MAICFEIDIRTVVVGGASDVSLIVFWGPSIDVLSCGSKNRRRYLPYGSEIL